MLRKESLLVLFLVGLCRFRRVQPQWRPSRWRCPVSSWSSWSACSQLCTVGVSIRRRHYNSPRSWPFWNICGTLHISHQSKSCGSARGGCEQICRDRDGQCSCQTGFSLSGKNCNDINECASNGGKGPCSHICRNTVGSFNCQCPTGYYLQSNKHNCSAYDCDNPSALFSSCPSNSYKDHISSVCKQVSVNCSQGTTFNKQCTLVCPQHYALGVIMTQQNKQFGEDYSRVDFSSVQSIISCDIKRQPGQSDVHVWSVKYSNLSNYFCRRTNDPPFELSLNGSALMEHAKIGTVIGVLSSQDQQQGQSFTYSIEQSNNLLATQRDKLINVWNDPKLNGNVFLSDGTLEVRIRSTDDGVPAMWLERSFNITVVDVNDPPDGIQLSNTIIYENATLGMVVGYLTAIDGDDPPGTNPHSNFDWKLVESDDGNFVIMGNGIRVNRSLQGEGKKIHKIVVNCSDFGSPPPIKSKITNFVINVVDIDEVPVSLTLSNDTVSEAATVGSVVGQLVVTEKDGDDVSFDISQSDPVTLDKFIINKAGCQGQGHAYDCKVDLVVNSSLNYEAKSWYKINVHANDTHGYISKQFHINVINENEAPTGIDLTGNHLITENAAAGTPVGQLVVIDPDNANIPLYQSHICFLDASNLGDEKYFIIDPRLVLQVKGAYPIDYEKVKNFTVQVTCKDSGHPSLSLSKVFVIFVKDVNESPRNLRLSSMHINENSPMGTPVGNLSSEDPDGPDDIHTYSIVGPADAPFFLGGINNQTLLASGPLDHEMNPTLIVIVRVTDSGGLFIEKTFTISVNDVNDPPTNLTLLTPFVMENNPQKVHISPIIFYDQDSDVGLCHLVNNASGRVEVEGMNLVVGPTTTDFESLPPSKQLSIQLNCSDPDGLFIEKSFFIQVKDVNEPPSQITLDGNTVKENEVGVVVGKVNVSDPDIGQSHQCDVYDLVIDSVTSTESLKPSRFFSVDDSFNLSTYNSLNFEEAYIVGIVINCSDIVSAPQRRLSKTKLFTITVKDVNEKPSGLCENPIYIDVLTSDGTVIAELHGRDPDNENAVNRDFGNHTVIVNQKQQLQYFLSPAQNSWPFSIDQNNLFTNRAITKPQNFTISVKVKDDGVIVARFSSSGFQYITVKPLSTVLNCTIIVTEKVIVEGTIRLEPSQVSVTALNGSLVGKLTTVTKFPQETFTYELEDVANVPFIIDNNNLLVAGKDIKDFRVPSSEEFIIPVTITSRGDISKPIRRSFYVRVMDGGLEPIKMCLVPNSVREDEKPGTVVGQLIIDDSSSPLSSCAKKHCCSEAGVSFNYKCRVDGPEENEIIDNLRNGSRLVSLHNDDFLLRTKLPLKYSDFADSNGSLGIHISCRGTQYPLLFFGQLIQVHVLYCGENNVCPVSDECPHCQHGGTCRNVISGYSCVCTTGFTGVHCETSIDYCQENPCLHGGVCKNDITELKCECIDGFSGRICERKESLCAECKDSTSCVTFVDAAIRCLEKKYQVPILVNEEDIRLKTINELENEIASILEEENNDSGNQGARKRRESSKFYVEMLQKFDVSSQSLLILTVLDSGKQFLPLLASDACALLKNTDNKCVKDCDILKLADLPCTSNDSTRDKNLGVLGESKSTGPSSATISGIVVAVIVVIIAILVGTVFYYRRKYKAARQNHGAVYYQTEGGHVDLSNPIYGDNRRSRIPPPSSREWEKRLEKDSDVYAQHNLDPSAVVKRNDIKVTENDLYVEPRSNGVPLEKPDSSTSKTSVNLSDEKDIKAAKSSLKKGTDYPKAGGKKAATEEGTLNPLYMASPPVTRLADKAATGSVLNVGTKSQKETLTPEEDLKGYLKGGRVKARANNYSQPQTHNRQGSGDPNSRQEDSSPLRMYETLSSFQNPVYDGLARSDEIHTDVNGTYSTIPALQDGTYSTIPALEDDTGASRGIYEHVGPPRPPRRSSSGPPEIVEVEEDSQYARLNFGDAQA